MSTDVDEDLAGRYDQALKLGQQLIRRQWTALEPATRKSLMASGFYSARGERINVEFPSGNAPDADCERLEHALGKFKLCLEAKLPLSTEKGAPIPHEALDDEILHSVRDLIYVRAWHDPDFLRLALGAVRTHQRATAMWLAGPIKDLPVAAGCVSAIFKAALVLSMPPALAIGISAAVRQDLAVASLAFYVLGAGALSCASGFDSTKKLEGQHLALDRWTRFELDGVAGGAGASATEYLRTMARDGVRVPPVAFDLARLLYDRVRGAAG